jgi:hypothetical protein
MRGSECIESLGFDQDRAALEVDFIVEGQQLAFVMDRQAYFVLEGNGTPAKLTFRAAR